MRIKKLLSAIALSVFAGSLFAAVNLNTADQAELATLDGVGDAKAAAIVKYREANGPFDSVDSVTEVTGIGQATLDKNRSEMTVEEAE